MISYIINIRSVCNKKKIVSYISRFLKSGEFNSRYIYVQLKFLTDNNNMILIGDKYLLDTQNDREIRTYRFYILQYYSFNYLIENEDKKIIKVVFDYSEATRKEYLSQVREFKNK